ncbi:MAG: aminodeoxychorismate lyase [Parahaliea sp.]
MSAELTWVDGALCDSLPLPDRGFAFGDGLFETLLLIDGAAVLADYHRERLTAGLVRLHFPSLPFTLEDALEQVAAAAPAGRAALRITATRGGGPRGYAPPVACTPRLVAQLSPLPAATVGGAEPAVVGLSSVQWPLQPQLAGLKHLNRLEQVLAARECEHRGWDEAVMMNCQGEAISMVAGSLFALCQGRLLTPRLDQCGVAGTRRRAIMERWAPVLGLAVVEVSLSVEALTGAQEVFYCNSLQGLRPVGRLGERQWCDFSCARALADIARDDLQGGPGR